MPADRSILECFTGNFEFLYYLLNEPLRGHPRAAGDGLANVRVL
jgi:hypothetical protein